MTSTGWPISASALGSAPTTSANPPVFENGTPSEATKTMRIFPLAGARELGKSYVRRCSEACQGKALARRSEGPSGFSMARRTRLGQHFLADSGYRRKIADSLEVGGEDWVLEVGAGRGAVGAWAWHPDFGYFGGMVQILTRPRILFNVPPGFFSPRPQVLSSLVEFRISPAFPEWTRGRTEQFLEFVKRCFAHKRKSLLNNLAASAERDCVEAAMDQLELPTTVRAEQVPIPRLAGLFAELEI